MKVVINSCYGGFSLSPLAVKRYYELQGIPSYFFYGYNRCSSDKPVDPASIDSSSWKSWVCYNTSTPTKDSDYLDVRPDNRSDPLLIQAIEELGLEASSGMCAKLQIIEIPDDTKFEISDYDGMESVHECHRSWY